MISIHGVCHSVNARTMQAASTSLISIKSFPSVQERRFTTNNPIHRPSRHKDLQS